METLFIYLLKSSGLIALFYLAYHFLVRKETFFNSNRWFLITGLFTSLLLPFFSIKKIIYVERPKIALEDLVAYANTNTPVQQVPAAEAFDWMQFVWISYIIIALLLLTKIIINFMSLFQMLYQQQKTKNESFTLVDLNHDIAPFSFFNYIVFNSSLYTEEELQSILLHEKVHSQEKHSFDVMVAKIFCILFWFNPFVWLYKKAIIQNLEYIADQKAVQQLQDPKVYQRALLKAISHQNCLSITNNFYQSLIKKRIVMLNTHQSHKRNSWKYTLVIPALIGFVFLFQIKTIAQEKESDAEVARSLQHREEVRLVINKNTSEAELKEEVKRLKEEHGVTLKCSKIKRNDKGEITGIKVEFKDKNGNKGVSHVDGKEPIAPIHFYKNNESIGFGRPRGVKVYANVPGVRISEGEAFAYGFNDSLPSLKSFDIDLDMELPELAELPEMPEIPEFGEAFAWSGDENSKIIIKKGGDKKPMVIVNGKVLSDDAEIEKALKEADVKGQYSISIDNEDGKESKVIINGKDVAKFKADAKAQVERMKPEIKKQMEMVRVEKEKVKEEMAKVRAEMDKRKPEMERAKKEYHDAKPEMEKAKAEIEKAKAEMIQAKEEMLKAKAELEKAKADLKKDK
ncbi:M56 family metallopeptidase [Flavobacterium terrisoli]|uniref:M56 family metallopeptidase n=1 Tax=Flavobacterium terrisoli TaxID=3242195 RepID=UPI002543EA46|nr:M56 family metallopeptidase [Flavobacterium buctense]